MLPDEDVRPAPARLLPAPRAEGGGHLLRAVRGEPQRNPLPQREPPLGNSTKNRNFNPLTTGFAPTK